jgi:hypothetical protein
MRLQAYDTRRLDKVAAGNTLARAEPYLNLMASP